MLGQDRLKQGFEAVKRILVDFNTEMQRLRTKHREEMGTLDQELASKKLQELEQKIK